MINNIYSLLFPEYSFLTFRFNSIVCKFNTFFKSKRNWLTIFGKFNIFFASFQIWSPSAIKNLKFRIFFKCFNCFFCIRFLFLLRLRQSLHLFQYREDHIDFLLNKICHRILRKVQTFRLQQQLR